MANSEMDYMNAGADPTVGTIESATNNTVSAYAATAAYVDICSITLSKGVWQLTGYLAVTEAAPTKTINGAIFHIGSSLTSAFRSLAPSGGGICLALPLKVTTDNYSITLKGFANTEFANTTKFYGSIYAVKIA